MKQRNTIIKSFTPHNLKFNKRDLYRCKKCGLKTKEIFPEPDLPGFCKECVDDSCFDCGIVLGDFKCSGWMCRKKHGKRSEYRLGLCKDCADRRKNGTPADEHRISMLVMQDWIDDQIYKRRY